MRKAMTDEEMAVSTMINWLYTAKKSEVRAEIEWLSSRLKDNEKINWVRGWTFSAI